MPEFYRLSEKPHGQKAQKATIRGTGDPFPWRDGLCGIPLPRRGRPCPPQRHFAPEAWAPTEQRPCVEQRVAPISCGFKRERRAWGNGARYRV